MDLATFEHLLTPAGAAALAAAAALRPTEAKYPACVDRLAKAFPPAVARAALDTVLLREKAAPKFARAADMFFTREALEMATGEVVARHRAGRFAGFGTVADLGCGIGGDAVALAAAGCRVVAVDSDPVRLRMAAANLAVHGFGGQAAIPTACGKGSPPQLVCGDVRTVELPPFDAAFADPGRRPGGRRTLSLADCEPPVAAIRDRVGRGFPLGVKVAPGVPHAEIRGLEAEAEFVAAGGELKECVLWFGPLRSANVRATVLPGGHTLVGEPGEADAGPVGRFVYDPSSAVTRAGLVGVLGTRLAARPIDPGVGFLSADAVTPTPFAAVYAVEEVLPCDAKTVAAWLRVRGVGRVTVVKRGSAIDADEFVRKLKLAGDGHRAVLLTRTGGKPVAVVGERVTAPA